MNGVIRKIIVGPNPKDAMAYYSGMKVGKGVVAHILHDDKHLTKYGKTRYLIYVEDEDSTALWKSIDGLPCVIEYDLNF